MTKEQFFTEKDKNYEFGVTLGQAFNLSVESLDIHQASDEEIVDRVYRLFNLILHTRLSEKFVDTFNEYHKRKGEDAKVVTIQ